MDKEAKDQSQTPIEKTDVPQDAILTRGFIRKLPGWKEQPREMFGRHGSKPNWSGETIWNGQPIDVKVWALGEETDIVVEFPQRKDTWRIKESPDPNRKQRPYISFALTEIQIPVYPLDPKDSWVEIDPRVAFDFDIRVIGFHDISKTTPAQSDDAFWREKDLLRHPDSSLAIPKSLLEKNSVYQSLMTLKTIMLQAKPNTP
jgi:hypothetical protein